VAYPAPMLTLDEARAVLLRHVSPLPPAEMELAAAVGHRMAVPLRSDVDLPPGDVSSMDGYAVRHADLRAGRPLPVVFEVAAGVVAEKLPPGCAARIFTGALLPVGADTVVPQEQSLRAESGSVVLEPLAAGSYVRVRGEVLAAGEPVATAGDVVTPQGVALLAAAGAHHVQVVPRPRLAVVITGSEVVPPTERPDAGQIRDSNGPTLDALAWAARLAPPTHFWAADDLAGLSATLGEAAAGADLVLTSGGVSVGDYDLVPDAVAELGGHVLFHRVAVKPGKPVLAARLGDGWLLGLPGNPVSVLASWWMFARPLAAALAGDGSAFDEEPRRAALLGPVANRGERTVLRPAVLGPGDPPTVRVLEWKGSHDLRSAAAANAFARIEGGCAHRAGDLVPCYPLER